MDGTEFFFHSCARMNLRFAGTGSLPWGGGGGLCEREKEGERESRDVSGKKRGDPRRMFQKQIKNLKNKTET